MAESLIEFCQLMYNLDTQKRVLTRLRDRIDEHLKTLPRSSRGKGKK